MLVERLKPLLARLAILKSVTKYPGWVRRKPLVGVPASVAGVLALVLLVLAVTGGDGADKKTASSGGASSSVLGSEGAVAPEETTTTTAAPAGATDAAAAQKVADKRARVTAASRPLGVQTRGPIPFALPKAGAPPAATPDCQKYNKNVVVVALTNTSAQIAHLNPAITSQGPIHTAAEPMFNGLLAYDPGSGVYGDLATDVVVADFGRTYEFTLRPGVKWHDGKDFTSADVKFSFEQALLGDPGHSRTKASVASALDRIDTPGPLAVVFRFKDSYSPLLQQLNVTEAPIIPKHVFEGNVKPDSPPAQRPIGTGPFKFVSKSSTDIRMDRNPTYFRPDLPCFAGMVESFVPDQGTQVALLEKGDVDWLGEVPGQDQGPGRLGGNRSVTLARAPRGPGGANCITTLGFNLTAKGDRAGQIGGPNPAGTPAPHPVLSDLNVRKAIAYAINRQQLLDQIQFGIGRVALAPISSQIPYAHAPQPGMPGFDPGLANSLLDGAGWTDRDGDGTRKRGAQRLQIDFTSYATGTLPTYGEAIRAQLKAVGIDLVTRPLPAYEQMTFVNRDFDTTIVSYCNGDDPVVGVRRQYFSDQVRTTGFTNAAGYKSPQMDTFWNNAQREPDQGRRAGFYRDIQSLAVRDLPYFWLVETVGTRGFRSDCSGFNVANTGLFAEAAFCRR